jgi:hypothetical protein
MKLDFPAFERHLKNFDFCKLFVEVLGWNHPASSDRAWQASNVPAIDFQYRAVGELGGVMALQVVMGSGVGSAELGQWPDEALRTKAWKALSVRHAENILIFTDKLEKASQSQWYWVKRDKHPETGKPKLTPRRHDYFRGQPVDLFASKLQAMVVELSELDSAGRMPVLEAARRIASALDVDKTTKKFFTAYQQQHMELLSHIEGIDDERDKRWYASVLLNRLMFVWFMQKKGFLAVTSAKPFNSEFNPDYDYLQTQLQKCQNEDADKGKNRFFGEFLNALFFEAFAKSEAERSPSAVRLTGQIPYLNGGLFLHHKLELDADHAPRVGTTLRVADQAFEGIFSLFASFTWHLDDTPGGDADEINPDVLGYIFEKYINQKAFGAYYTRPEITGYLAERSIYQMILERTHEPAIPELGIKEIKFATVSDLLARMDARTALKLVNGVLPSISILDPAVGSGAFLVAALKTLINVYYAVVGRAELGASSELENWLKHIKKDHASVGYYIKRRIVTDNLYGVDIMEEAAEIAKLRLFLAMVSSVRRVEDLEPLPNIDFNILAGNSLVGLTRVDEQEFSGKQHGLFAKPFSTLLVEKNRLMGSYRNATEMGLKGASLRDLRDEIDAQILETNETLNDLLVDNFLSLGVKYEQATWDDKKKALGKPTKRVVSRADIAAQTPFHWGYVFDDIIHKRGGFDIVLANPPWEVFKPQAKEFFAEYSGVVSKNKMTIKEFEKEQGKLLQRTDVQAAWLEYESRFPHMSSYYRAAPEFKFQSAVVGGKKTGSDLNLYKLFVERAFHLMRPGGHCGIVIPSGIYTDLGAKGLRDLLFTQTKIEGLFCFENRKEIFEGVHRSFKFVVLTFEKSETPRLQERGEANASAPPNDLLAPQATADKASGTLRFPTAFMRHEVEELTRFPDEGALWLDTDLIKLLSPDSLSVTEFKSELDVHIAKKLTHSPSLEATENQPWIVQLSRELDMTNDSAIFLLKSDLNASPLIQGAMIQQFEHLTAPPKFWISLPTGRARILGRTEDVGQKIGYQTYRLVHRRIASNTNSRTMIANVLPPNYFCADTAQTIKNFLPPHELLYLVAVMNSYVVDWEIRQRVTAHLDMHFVYKSHVPRLTASDPRFAPIVSRAAKLVCTSPEFDDLAKAVGLKSHANGATDPAERARLRAELDGLVAHLYGLTEAEFVHILATFPLVADPVRVAAHNAYRDVERGLVR